MMPVKSEFPYQSFEDILSSMDDNLDEFMADMGLNQSPPPECSPLGQSLLSDDIWKKFEFDRLMNDLSWDALLLDSDLPANTSLDCEIRNHDCMWAGHCGSKEHPADEPRTPIIIPPPPVVLQKTQPKTTPKQPIKQQSLLKSNIRNSMPPPPPAAPPPPPPTHTTTLQTPPMSDDEESKTKPTEVLKILHEAITNCDLEEDSDLCEYFKDEDLEEAEDFYEEDDDDDEEDTEEEEDEVPEQAPPQASKTTQKQSKNLIQTCQFAAENDHSYHKDKNVLMRMGRAALPETPSDSEEEEEIDVVSVNEKNSNRIVCSLPTNPSSRDRQQLEGRMATAITKKHIYQKQRHLVNVTSGIKTLLPTTRKLCSVPPMVITPSTSLNKQRRLVDSTRGVKRTKQYRTPPSGGSSATSSPYKRRAHSTNSSDSEHEPSEKRNLHNNMERQRRIDLRNAFEDLRVLLPVVSKKERAAKVVILREAAQYCDELGNQQNAQVKKLDDLRKRQEFLRQQVSRLRRNLAANR